MEGNIYCQHGGFGASGRMIFENKHRWKHQLIFRPYQILQNGIRQVRQIFEAFTTINYISSSPFIN